MTANDLSSGPNITTTRKSSHEVAPTTLQCYLTFEVFSSFYLIFSFIFIFKFSFSFLKIIHFQFQFSTLFIRFSYVSVSVSVFILNGNLIVC